MSSIIFSGIGPLGPTVARGSQSVLRVVYALFNMRNLAEERCGWLKQTYSIDCEVVDLRENRDLLLRIDPDLIDVVEEDYHYAVLLLLPKTF